MMPRAVLLTTGHENDMFTILVAVSLEIETDSHRSSCSTILYSTVLQKVCHAQVTACGDGARVKRVPSNMLHATTMFSREKERSVTSWVTVEVSVYTIYACTNELE